jgi:hypothetical protein
MVDSPSASVAIRSALMVCDFEGGTVMVPVRVDFFTFQIMGNPLVGCMVT